MLHYGLMQDNSTLIMLNTIGSILNWGYVLAYVIVVKNKVRECLKSHPLLCNVA